MKSRFAVSVLFILIASTFASDATGALDKLRSWTGKVCGRYAVQVCHCLSSHGSAVMSAIKDRDKDGVAMIRLDGRRLALAQNCASTDGACVVGTISPDGKTITLNSDDATGLGNLQGDSQGIVFKVVGSDRHSGTFEIVTTAARQVREVLSLMRLQ